MSTLIHQTQAHLDGQRRQIDDDGLEMKLWAFSICSAARNDFAPQLDVSSLLATISLQVNVTPFPGLKTLLATLMHALHLLPRMNCLVAAADCKNISRHSFEPCT